VVNFLERETTMINGPEVLSRLTNCQVVYFEMIRERRGVYKIVFSQITRNPSEEPEGAITGKFAELLEKTIREQPDNWLWSHKRWKR
jgi:KDO2-lipid IV(A) lauroyltransferase